MAAKVWPPPGFPLVEGHYILTAGWSIELPEPFARLVKEGDLVLWRPGLTLWVAAWNNGHGRSRAERLASIKEGAAPERFADFEIDDDHVTRLSYRLHDTNDDGPVESVYGDIITDDGHLQLGVYFDDPADESLARQLIGSVRWRPET
jgi:hypothetical protein